MQSSSQFITTSKPTPSWLQAGYPSCRPTNSVWAQKENYKVTDWKQKLKTLSCIGSKQLCIISYLNSQLPTVSYIRKLLRGLNSIVQSKLWVVNDWLIQCKVFTVFKSSRCQAPICGGLVILCLEIGLSITLRILSSPVCLENYVYYHPQLPSNCWHLRFSI